jgi:hypothetical protein
MQGVSCDQRLADGSVCNRPAQLFDARNRRMLCRDHAVAPLERVFGPRTDLDEKAEYVLRFLGLPSHQRHALLEELSAEERREFLHLTRLFDKDGD